MNTTQICYIRSRGKSWTHCESHHQHGLDLYLDIRRNKNMRQTDPILICTQRKDGSIFMAYYRKKNPSIYSFQEYSYDLGDMGDEYDIMYCPLMVSLGPKP
jgi:hypothetical protein